MSSKAAQYWQMSQEELEHRVSDLRQSLFNLRVRTTTRELENVSRIKLEKRELARVLTVLQAQQKEVGGVGRDASEQTEEKGQ